MNLFPSKPIPPCTEGRHGWENGKGSDDIRCVSCGWCPIISNRYKCSNCYIEICKQCYNREEPLDSEYEQEVPVEAYTLETEVQELRQRVQTLELRIANMEQFQEARWEKFLHTSIRKILKEDTPPESSELIEVSTTFCKRKPQSIRIPVILQIGKMTRQGLAMIDTGMTHTKVCSSIIPSQLVKPLQDSFIGQDVNGNLSEITHGIPKIGIIFQDTCNTKLETTLRQVPLRNLTMHRCIIILGLDYILANQGQLIVNNQFTSISRNTVTMVNQDIKSVQSTLLFEGDKGNRENCECKIPFSCQENLDMSLDLFEVEVPSDLISINQLSAFKIPEDLAQWQSKLEKMEIIGEKPLTHWNKHKSEYQIEIINPELIISSESIPASNKEMKLYEEQIEKLVKNGCIQRSESRHRSPTFWVYRPDLPNADPRMVINYKRLNDNTQDNGYTLPMKDMIVNRIQGSNYYSKFDLKSGYHQIKLHPDSIPWSAFICPNPIGHYEWKVMPFGLKNAPAVFQKRMDEIFAKVRHFTAVYIDDILVFSKTKEEHYDHLRQVFKIFEEIGLIISKKKISLCQTEIEFLGSIIGQGTIRLQEHISKKVLEFPDKLKDLKQIQSFCGLVNQARPYIKDIGTLIGPIYKKTGKNGKREFNQQDIKLIQLIKSKFSNLPKLHLPLDKEFLIVETDGSAKGWGAVLKARPNEYSAISLERICRYSSGLFKEKGELNNNDFEVLGIIYALNAFELFLIGRSKFIIRTDCEAIVKFYSQAKLKTSKKVCRNRWANLVTSIQGKGLRPVIEHVPGTKNNIADILSRPDHDPPVKEPVFPFQGMPKNIQASQPNLYFSSENKLG